MKFETCTVVNVGGTDTQLQINTSNGTFVLPMDAKEHIVKGDTLRIGYSSATSKRRKVMGGTFFRVYNMTQGGRRLKFERIGDYLEEE